MMTYDSAIRYGSITRLFHWGMAVLIGWQMLKFFDRIDEGKHWVGQKLVSWHLSIGTLLLLLIVARILWTSSQRVRPVQDPANAFLVKAGHGMLYAVMLLMPLTGILTMLGGGFGLTAFGLVIFAEGEKIAWAATLGSVHSPLAWLLLFLTLGHIFMALYHHFIMKDDSLRRMI